MNERTSRTDKRTGSVFQVFVLALAALLLLLAGVGAAAASDANKPTPVFVTPMDGATVEGYVQVIVYAPLQPKAAVSLSVDGGAWQPMSTGGNGLFSAKWNTGQDANGKHTLTTRFLSGPGEPPVAAISIEVLVANRFPDGETSGTGSRLANFELPNPCFSREEYKSDCPGIGPGPKGAAAGSDQLASDNEPAPCFKRDTKEGCPRIGPPRAGWIG